MCYCIGVLGVGALTNHLVRHHKEVWDTYVLKRDANKAAVANAKKSEQSGMLSSILVVD